MTARQINDISDGSNFSHTFYIRSRLESLIAGSADFLKINDTSKSPIGAWSRESSPNRYRTIPLLGNYGVIPRDRLFVLDFDVDMDNDSSLDEHLDFFSDFFQINIRESLMVHTQTGGVHCYLYFPPGTRNSDLKDIPKMSLRPYSKAFSRVLGKDISLNADIRSGASASYVLGPTSSLPSEVFSKEVLLSDYRVSLPNSLDSHSFEILTVSDNSLQRLESVYYDFLLERSGKIAHSRKESSKSEEESISLCRDDSFLDSSIWPDEKALSLIDDYISMNKGKTFHSLRAFVKSALHCCYSDEVIAKVCAFFNIDRDTYTDSRIKSYELMRDLKDFVPDYKYHSKFCSIGRAKPSKREVKGFDSFSLDNYLDVLKEKVKARDFKRKDVFRKVNPRVLDFKSIADDLMRTTNRKSPTQQIKDSMAIVEHFLNPLSNVGATRIVLSRAKVSETLEISGSRVAAAIRLLSNVGVISLKDRQKTGLSSTYVVNSFYVHKFLTNCLRKTWGAHEHKNIVGKKKLSLYFDISEGVFRHVGTNEKVFSTLNTQKISYEYKKQEYSFTRGVTSGAFIANSYSKEDVSFVQRGILLLKAFFEKKNMNTFVDNFFVKTGMVFTAGSVVLSRRPVLSSIGFFDSG